MCTDDMGTAHPHQPDPQVLHDFEPRVAFRTPGPGAGRTRSRTVPSRTGFDGPVAPNWPTDITLGLGGYLGARMQSRLPDILIRRIIGVLAIAIASQFLRAGLS